MKEDFLVPLEKLLNRHIGWNLFPSLEYDWFHALKDSVPSPQILLTSEGLAQPLLPWAGEKRIEEQPHGHAGTPLHFSDLATLSPPCPTKPGLVQLFGPSLGLIQLQSHASGGILIYMPILSQDFALEEKLVGLILGNGMGFGGGSIWPQGVSSTKVSLRSGISGSHALFLLLCPRECPSWLGHNWYSRVVTKSYREADRIQLKTPYVCVTGKLF